MPMSRALMFPLFALLAAPLVAACGSDDDSSSGDSVSVRAGDDSCEVGKRALSAGKTTFAVKNTGSQITEVYVYGEQDGKYTKVISEVENIGPGLSRDMTVDLAAGEYEIACKPGQTGDGIRTPIKVTGGGTEAAEAEAAYDREIELATDGTAITGLSGDAKAGEKIEFKLENNADAARTLEIKNPSGTVAGEAEDIAPGEDGELVVELTDSGTWQIIVEGEGVEDVTASLAVS